MNEQELQQLKDNLALYEKRVEWLKQEMKANKQMVKAIQVNIDNALDQPSMQQEEQQTKPKRVTK